MAHLRNHDEDIEGYLDRRQDFIDGKTKGMPSASLGVAVRMQQEGIDYLPTPKARDSQAEGYEAGLRRSQPQVGTIVKGIVDGDERVTMMPAEVDDDSLLRTPSVTDSTGGAISENQARERGRMVKVADQAAQLAFENGLKVSPSIEAQLLPTPNTMDGLPPREGEALDRQLRRGVENGSVRNTTGNLREDVIVFLPTPNTMEHREIKTPEQIAELKEKSPGGYRNLREVVIHEVIADTDNEGL